MICESISENSYIIATPTGASASLINGQTLHSVFQIPRKISEFKALTGQKGRRLEKTFENVQYIILDEFSLIGCETLAMIDLRCKQVTGNVDEDFGGLHIFLLGDIKQLPPVKMTPCYSLNAWSTLAQQGRALFTNFDKIYELQHCHRQENDMKFLKVLDNISNGFSTIEDYKYLSTRFSTNLTTADQESFKHAIRLFTTREEVKAYNLKKMSNMKNEETNAFVPVVKIPGVHANKESVKGSDDDAEGLQSTLFLSEGSQIMLRSNLWVSKGLVNGTLGIVHHILYDEHQQPSRDAPSIIICEFPTYTGPGLIPGTKLVPIKPIMKSWKGNNIVCTRTQFPIVLCYACTIHKAQGMTLDKVLLDNDFTT